MSALRAALPALVNQVNEKLLVDERFECGCYPCELAGMVRNLQDRFGRTLVGVFEFGLADRLAEEFRALVTPLMYRGAGEDFPGTVLDAWLMALRTGLSDRDGAGPAGAVAELRRSLPGSWAAPEPADLPGPAAEFLELLLARRRRAAAGMMLGREAGGPESGFEGLVVPALGRVGELWARNRLTVAEEHAATEICRYAVLRALDAAEPAPARGLRALAACAPGEEHELGAEMAAGLLELSGWNVMFVGRSAPAEEVVATARRFEPHVALLAATTVASLPALSELAGRLREAVPGVGLVAGGQAAGPAARGPGSAFDAAAASVGEGRAAAERLAG